ncbi:hypothetical protein BDQ12DRAFT_658445 [Crucibulum laeve]|uniref:FAD-binding domain-containing protein n=1 Tax=Crucibulum laeve TaxID=68775 RepID=A0A5C3LWF1_9AGAR|nr:hypothetical protein BDQ12DRAFT_658445 [Crucibulum laeve]
MTNPPTQKVAICGAGIAGLTLACILSTHAPHINIDIYESKPEVSAIGEGVAIWKRSWQIIQDLGLEDEMRRRGVPFPLDGERQGPIFRKSDQKEGVAFHNHVMPYGPTAIQRPTLLDILQMHLSPNCQIHTSKRLVNFIESSSPYPKINLKFSDGTESNADVFVGADGVHSIVRSVMYAKLSEAGDTEEERLKLDGLREPIWTGTFAYRCTVPFGMFKEKYPDHPVFLTPKIWCGKNQHVVTQPWPETGIIGVSGFVTLDSGEGTLYEGPWVTDVKKEEVIKKFESWEDDLVVLMNNITKASRWAIHVVKPLPNCVSGRIALMGDAAHAMTPHQGVGGGQAIEDAHILGQLLSHVRTTNTTLPEILKIYEKIRLPQAQIAWQKSRTNGLIYEFMHPDFQHIQPGAQEEELKELGEAINESFGWLAEGGCYEDWSRAEELVLTLKD